MFPIRFPVLIVATVSTLACSSGSSGSAGPADASSDATTTADGGTGGSPAAAFVVTNVGPGDLEGVNKATECKLPAEQWLAIGTSMTTVANGSTMGEKAVAVTCSVTPEGGVFTVSASATLQTAGSFSISGKISRNTTTGQTVTASFTRGDTGTFRQSDCDLTFMDTDALSGIEPGRIRAMVTCTRAAFTGGQERTCQAMAEFSFENCSR